MMWALDECLEEGAEVGIIALGAEGTGTESPTARTCHGPLDCQEVKPSQWDALKEGPTLEGRRWDLVRYRYPDQADCACARPTR